MRIVSIKLRDVPDPPHAVIGAIAFWEKWRGQVITVDLDDVMGPMKPICDSDVSWRILGPAEFLEDICELYGRTKPFYVCRHAAEVGD